MCTLTLGSFRYGDNLGIFRHVYTFAGVFIPFDFPVTFEFNLVTREQ